MAPPKLPCRPPSSLTCNETQNRAQSQAKTLGGSREVSGGRTLGGTRMVPVTHAGTVSKTTPAEALSGAPSPPGTSRWVAASPQPRGAEGPSSPDSPLLPQHSVIVCGVGAALLPLFTRPGLVAPLPPIRDPPFHRRPHTIQNELYRGTGLAHPYRAPQCHNSM
jgi:hypothetical protein